MTNATTDPWHGHQPAYTQSSACENGLAVLLDSGIKGMSQTSSFKFRALREPHIAEYVHTADLPMLRDALVVSPSEKDPYF